MIKKICKNSAKKCVNFRPQASFGALPIFHNVKYRESCTDIHLLSLTFHVSQ